MVRTGILWLYCWKRSFPGYVSVNLENAISNSITMIYLPEHPNGVPQTLKPEDEFKTGLIELYIKGYIRKLKSWQIQDWANQFQISIGLK